MPVGHAPSEQALIQGVAASNRVSGRAAPLRQDFVRRRDGRPSPLAALLRGGQGGEVRLKLLLSVVWIAARPPHETDFPARGWAELFDLEDPAGSGARRVTEAFRWLEKRHFVRIERRPGHPSVVFIRDERATGNDYQPPWKTKSNYIKVPGSFWSRGWVASLSAVGVAMLLILLDQDQFRGGDGPFWIAPSRSKDLYGLSQDTWTKGSAELAAAGLIEITRMPVDENSFGFRRMRNRYEVNRDRFDTPVDWAF